jgi:hypothetical protein
MDGFKPKNYGRLLRQRHFRRREKDKKVELGPAWGQVAAKVEQVPTALLTGSANRMVNQNPQDRREKWKHEDCQRAGATPCSPVNFCLCFGDTHCFLLQWRWVNQASIYDAHLYRRYPYIPYRKENSNVKFLLITECPNLYWNLDNYVAVLIRLWLFLFHIFLFAPQPK